ncbi:hypothetical protein DWB84_06830 [Saccharophagus sp. K07]|nr:hypothetical protein [Saccharophagus sp. K07]
MYSTLNCSKTPGAILRGRKRLRKSATTMSVSFAVRHDANSAELAAIKPTPEKISHFLLVSEPDMVPPAVGVSI